MTLHTDKIFRGTEVSSEKWREQSLHQKAPSQVSHSQLALGVVLSRGQSRGAAGRHTECAPAPQDGSSFGTPLLLASHPSQPWPWLPIPGCPGQGKQVSHHHWGPCVTNLWSTQATFHNLFMPNASSVERSRVVGQQFLSTLSYLCVPPSPGLADILKTFTKPVPASMGTCMSAARLWPMDSPEQGSSTQKHSPHHPCPGICTSTAKAQSNLKASTENFVNLQPRCHCL